MQTVMVIGSPGSGKSTFARALGARTGLPVVHLDQLFWLPGWVIAPSEIFRTRVDAAAASQRWIIDGNYTKAIDSRLSRADTIIWLRRSRRDCYVRVARRVLSSYGRVRADMAPGCPEKLDWEFMKYIWRYEARSEPQLVAALDRHDAWPRTVTLRTDVEAARYLSHLVKAA